MILLTIFLDFFNLGLILIAKNKVINCRCLSTYIISLSKAIFLPRFRESLTSRLNCEVRTGIRIRYRDRQIARFSCLGELRLRDLFWALILLLL